MLTNAIYFKARWTHEFRKAATVDASFHTADSQQIIVRMMHQTHRLGYGASHDVQVLELTYAVDGNLIDADPAAENSRWTG